MRAVLRSVSITDQRLSAVWCLHGYYFALGWAAFIGGAVWSSRHEPAPFHYTFWHALPGITMLFALLFALWPSS